MATPLDQIDTIVVVMMENQSFDHVLGFISHESFPDKRTDVDGLHQHSSTFDWDNPDNSGNLYRPTATPDGYLPTDLPHGRVEAGHDAVKEQIDGGSMLGFIKSYFAYQQADRSPSPMRFCDPEDIPITATLARHHTICDRWFASLPTDTFPNRLMSLSGYTCIDDTSLVKPPLKMLPNQKTIFEWLTKKGKNFKIYVDADAIGNLGPPASMLLMENQWPFVFPNVHTLDTLTTHWNAAGKAPDVIYCEPFYNDFATAVGLHGGDNHPPLPMAFGEEFLAKVYKALVSNPARWNKTMLIVCHDEHGGFFDHVAPPAMKSFAPPGNIWLKPKEPFNTLGVRVPGMVISPLVEDPSVYNGVLDHTSILQLMVEKFGAPGDLAFFGEAQARKDNHIQSLSQTLTRMTPRANPIVNLPALPPMPGSGTTPALSEIAKIFSDLVEAASSIRAKFGL